MDRERRSVAILMSTTPNPSPCPRDSTIILCGGRLKDCRTCRRVDKRGRNHVAQVAFREFGPDVEGHLRMYRRGQ